MSIKSIEEIRFDDKGLVTAIAQDYDTGQILMVAYMNRESLKKTLETKKMTYWSRSRERLWLKGEQSGHFQHVRAFRIDCDGDALLFSVTQEGGACHKGYRSCFYRRWDGEQWCVDGEKVFEPDEVY